jgi:hypothetical protein
VELFRAIVSAAFFMAVFGAGFFLTPAACYHSSMARDPFPPAIQAKLDSRLIQRVHELELKGQMDQMLSVLIRTASEISPDQEALLKVKGVSINSKLGSVISAGIPAGLVRDVAELEFVVRIELAKKLKKPENER